MAGLSWAAVGRNEAELCGCVISCEGVLDTTATNVDAVPPSAPAVWFMEPPEPNLTEQMLNELSKLLDCPRSPRHFQRQY